MNSQNQRQNAPRAARQAPPPATQNAPQGNGVAGGRTLTMNPNPLLMEHAMWQRIEAFADRAAKAGYAGGNGAQAFMIVMKGIELGFTAIQSLERICIVNGKSCVDSQGLLAVMQGRCPKAVVSRVYEYARPEDERAGTAPIAVAVTVANVRPEPFTVRYTMEQARIAGLAGKPTWKAYPAEMLYWKAVARAVREHAPEVIAGLYLVDEMENARDVTPRDVAPPPAADAPIAEALPPAQPMVTVVSEAAAMPATVTVEKTEAPPVDDVPPPTAADAPPEAAVDEHLDRMFAQALRFGYQRNHVGVLARAWFSVRSAADLTDEQATHLVVFCERNPKAADAPVPAAALPPQGGSR